MKTLIRTVTLLLSLLVLNQTVNAQDPDPAPIPPWLELKPEIFITPPEIGPFLPGGTTRTISFIALLTGTQSTTAILVYEWDNTNQGWKPIGGIGQILATGNVSKFVEFPNVIISDKTRKIAITVFDSVTRQSLASVAVDLAIVDLL